MSLEVKIKYIESQKWQMYTLTTNKRTEFTKEGKKLQWHVEYILNCWTHAWTNNRTDHVQDKGHVVIVWEWSPSSKANTHIYPNSHHSHTKCPFYFSSPKNHSIRPPPYKDGFEKIFVRFSLCLLLSVAQCTHF